MTPERSCSFYNSTTGILFFHFLNGARFRLDVFENSKKKKGGPPTSFL